MNNFFCFDGKDLIYEGIATVRTIFQVRTENPDGKDLIYEGIATFPSGLIIIYRIKDGKDLIYEGIATHGVSPDKLYQRETKDGKDLIYEGIATLTPALLLRQLEHARTEKT